jgi:deoxyribonuclease-4
MLFGYHVSIAGGLYKAFEHAKDLECDVIQIFVSSPQVWQTPTVSDSAVEKFKLACKKSKVKQVLVHAAYLPNLASDRASLRNLSLHKLKEEAKIAYRIGADGYNFHCGSNKNSNAEGIKLAIQTLNRLAELTDEKWPVKLIIESDAGAGNRIGDTVEELACHLFVSGTDLRTSKDISALLAKFDKLIGLRELRFIHINDAKFPLGSKKDRHANIGQGEIGEIGIKALLHQVKLKQVPFILETPQTGNIKIDIGDIKLLRKLVK